ncbi:DUF664 domain-containing protein [Nocardioides aestuarii]|uniref:DUF664 domain-containing protein n=1 Tax=Nocardioides aestuarii TaxID=252231 RepID=A0ABW4TK77_9ACTN
MTETPPWAPPVAGTDVDHVLASLERLRVTFRWKADGLDEAGLRARIDSSALSLASLLKHLSLVEDHYSTTALDGSSIGSPWTEIHDGTDDFTERTAVEDSAASLYELYDGAVLRAKERYAAAVAAGGLDQPTAMEEAGQARSLRRLFHDLLEEYGRHTGHADLLREAVDGRVGEDPPLDYRPW